MVKILSEPPIGEDTRVSFSTRVTEERGKVLAVYAGDLRQITDVSKAFLVVTDCTPFHPVNPRWPDQPGDTGLVRYGVNEWHVIDTITGTAVSGGEIVFGDAPPTEGSLARVVGHVVEGSPAEDLRAGDDILLAVDALRRAELSKSHTACHLMALALNYSLSGAWSKDARRDSLGSPDFDAMAIQNSQIDSEGSIDTYRLGKSLRKAGFAKEFLLERCRELQKTVEELVNGWIAKGAQVNIRGELTSLSGRRLWSCELPIGLAEIPCGGTHVSDIGEIGAVNVSLEIASESLIVRTNRRR